MAVDVANLVAKISLDSRGMQAGLHRVRAGLSRIGSFVGGVATGMAGAFGVQRIREIDQLSNRLERVFGAQGAARARAGFEAISNRLGVSTTDLTRGFLDLQTSGIVPTGRDLERLADLSAQFGQDFGRTIDSIRSAFRGEFDPIESLGMGLKVAEGNNNLLIASFGKFREAIPRTNEGILDFVRLIADSQAVQGAAQQAAGGLTGALTRLTNSFDSLLFRLAESGVLDAVSRAIATVSNIVGGVASLAQGVGGVVGGAVGAFSTGGIAGLAEFAVGGNRQQRLERLAEQQLEELRRANRSGGVVAQ